MAENKCTLSNEDLLQQCEQWVHDLAKSGGKDWCLQVPVNFNRDPDMLFMELINRFKANVQQGNIWVKASDLPEKEHNYHVKATTKFQGYNHNDTALWRNNKWEFDSDNGRIVVEWLDESGCEAKKALEGTLKELIALINEKAKYGIPVDLAVGTKAGAMCIEIEELTRKALEG